MTNGQLVDVGRVDALWRYPVKSMLGEPLGSVAIDEHGIDGDRRFAVVDAESGMVASAKRPRRWQRLLLLRSEMAGPDEIRILFPDGRSVLSTEPGIDKLLSEFLGCEVTLSAQGAPGLQLERAVPEAVLENGPAADVDVTLLDLAAGAPPGTFFDFSAMQLITTASLERVAAAHSAGRADAIRYRPNVVIETKPGLSGFIENEWAGHRVHLGPDVILDVATPSPRCAVPTLRHGDLPDDAEALRVPLQHNYVPVTLEGFGSAPCLGAHAMVAAGGRIASGDQVRLETAG